MPHVRLRKFNTSTVYRNVAISNDMCMVVRGLALPEMMMEVDIDAVIPEDEYTGA